MLKGDNVPFEIRTERNDTQWIKEYLYDDRYPRLAKLNINLKLIAFVLCCHFRTLLLTYYHNKRSNEYLGYIYFRFKMGTKDTLT